MNLGIETSVDEKIIVKALPQENKNICTLSLKELLL